MDNKFYLLFGVAFVAIGLFMYSTSGAPAFSMQASQEGGTLGSAEVAAGGAAEESTPRAMQKSAAPMAASADADAGGSAPGQSVQAQPPATQAAPPTLSMTASILSIISGLLSILKFIKETFLPQR